MTHRLAVTFNMLSLLNKCRTRELTYLSAYLAHIHSGAQCSNTTQSSTYLFALKPEQIHNNSPLPALMHL